MAPTFYVVHGTQELLLEEWLQRLRARMPAGNADFNITELDGSVVRVAEVLNLASTSPFLAKQRLVIARGLLTWLSRTGAGKAGKREADALYEGLPTLPPTARLALVEQRDLEPLTYGRQRSNRFVQLAQSDENGFTQAFRSPQNPVAWVQRRAQGKYEAEIERNAARALADLTRGDLRRVDNELLKLASYVDGARAINEEDVALLTPWVAEARTFDLTDAIAERRTKAGAGVAATDAGRGHQQRRPDPFRHRRDAFSAPAAGAASTCYLTMARRRAWRRRWASGRADT